MASTVLPNGIIIPEKYSRDWYNDLYHNWQELDNLLAGGGANDGTLTIQKNGATVGTFSANQATDETIDIEVPAKTSDLTNDSDFVQSSDLATVATSGNYNDLDNKPTIPTVNNATLTIQKNGTTVDTFTANASSNVTCNITVPTKTSDLTNDSGFITEDNTKIPLAGSNAISGDLIPSTDGTVNLGGTSYQWNNAYIKSLTINGVACGDILTHNVSEFVDLSSNQTVGGDKTFSGTTTTHDVIPATTDTYDLGSSAKEYNNAYIKSLTINGSQFSPNNYNKKREYLTQIGKYVDFYNSEYDTHFGARIHITDPTSTSQNSSSSLVFECQEFLPWFDGSSPIGNASQKWGQIYSTNSTISTSDKRLKNSIKNIDDALLDAWGSIEPKQYKFNDATEKKGTKARYHTGYLAQDIQAECEKQGVNASDYGLFCYDEWEEQEEISEEIETEKDGKIIKEKRIIQPRREKGNSYALRYEEALVVECKYLRRCIARLTARIEELEKGNNTK